MATDKITGFLEVGRTDDTHEIYLGVDDGKPRTNTIYGIVPPELDAIADVVLAYKPKPKTKAAKRRKKRAQNAQRKRR